MNLLTDSLPSLVAVNGVAVPVNTDFRAALRCLLAFEDDGLTGTEKQVVLLANLFPEPVSDPLAACKVAVRFLNGGEDGKEEDGPRLFSWTKDAGLIFAAFRQTHGIDLETAKIHWWAFLALFMDLGSETAFCQLVGLRKRVKTGKASKEERAAAREMGAAFEVPEPDDRTLEEREAEAEFMRILEGAGVGA